MSTSAWWAGVLVLAAGGTACFTGGGNDATPTAAGTSGEGAPCTYSNAPRLSNEDVMTRLGASCKDCHGAGSSKPFFESLGAFNQLLAYNSAWVVRGKPGESELLALLRGQAKGSYPQMPLSGAPFATAGNASITMAELEEWVTTMGDPTASAPLEPPSSVTRVTAEQYLAVLDATLGIAPDELLDSAAGTPKKAVALPVGDPNTVGGWLRNHYNDDVSQVVPRFMALGGPDWLEGQRRVHVWTPSAIQLVIQLSQARCRYAVESAKPNLFRDAQPSDVSAEAEPAIRTNIAQFYLRAVGQSATEPTVDTIYRSVFVPYQTASKAGWIGVCAAIMRHPLVLSL